MTGRTGAGAADAPAWRADIDGLRAIAILAVVGYHFFPAYVQGGFVGVDIFFVISGYLITRILLSSRDAGRFSILAFYAARVRRIFPALVLVLATVLVGGWACLYAEERDRLGTQVAAGAEFLSNFLLWRESGYFDAAIETKPLAHLWSLGVEEQFYLVWPWLIWALAEQRHILRVLLGLLAASLAANILLVAQHQHMVFYLPVFRFWELLAGAVVAVVERRGWPAWLPARANLLSFMGTGLLAASLLLINDARQFPGWWAILPVGGTLLLIAAGPTAPCNRTLLSHRVMVAIGWISYPLYLWHWPLLVFARTLFNAEPNGLGLLLLLAVALVFATLTWKWIESPARAPGHGGRKVAVLGVLMVGVGLAGTRFGEVGGLLAEGTGRFGMPVPPEVIMQGNPDIVEGCRLADPSTRGLMRYCVHDARGPARFALVGDSKAEVLFNGLVRTSSAAGRWLFIGGTQPHRALVPVLSDQPQFQRSQVVVRAALDSLVANPEVEYVVIATATRALYGLPRDDTLEGLPNSPNHEAALEGLRKFTAELLRGGKNVILLVDNPTLPDVHRCLMPARFAALRGMVTWFNQGKASGCDLKLARHLELSATYRRMLEQVRELAPERVRIFDTLPYLCDEKKGICTSTDGNGALYSYSDHISDYAAGLIGKGLNEALAGVRASP